MIVKVRCTYTIDVEVGDDPEYLDGIFFHIEENSCPGTGPVGGALMRHMEKHDKASTCWACALGGENEVLEVNGEKVRARAERDQDVIVKP